MFIDLVGSTELAARLDPEDTSKVIRDYQDACAEVVRRWDGHVAKFMGDGILAYFGWPQAHEDDAERAVRAGLALIEGIARQATPAGDPLSARIGIATGLVVVGELIGEGSAREETVVGETPSLAARLQALAEPGGLIISDAARRLIGHLFDLVDLGPQSLKGFALPLRAWRVVGVSAAESRFEAMHGQELTTLIGREHELDLLLERWAWARDGEGQVVLLAGEPGIGKSRLVQALRARLAADPHTPLAHYCSPHHVDSTLYPVIRLLERAAGFARDDSPEVKRGKLRALLALGTSRVDEATTLVADLLDLPKDLRQPPLNPQRKAQRTIEVLLDQVEGLAAARPVLAIYEDVHWIDPTSLETLGMLVERAQRLPVLILITYRPEFAPPWSGHSHVTQLSLARLTQRHGRALIGRVAAGQVLPDDIREQIAAKADGVPLFLEELTKAVVESGLLSQAARRHGNEGPLPPLAIPATLHDSLMARLDRLAPVKEVAQAGAVIGREFSYDLLAAVTDRDEAALTSALHQLVASELVFRRGIAPQATYSFKHALVRDAAYSSLLKSRRRQLHSRISDVLEERFPEVAATQPEILAHHLEEADQIERALDYWRRAGERAAERSANVEAIRHFSRGLDALRRLPDSAGRDQKELALQIALGTPLIAVQGYSALRTGAAFGRARALCERLGQVEPLVATLSGEFVYHFVRGDYAEMRRVADETRQASERISNPIVALAGHRLAGIAAMYHGAFLQARREFEAILRLYDGTRHRSEPVHYVHDPKVSALTYLALVLWLLGFPEQARRSSVAAFRCAEDLNQANLTAHVHNFAGAGLDELLGDISAVRAHADAIVDLADRHDLGYWRLNGLILRGWAMVHEGAADAGIELIRQNALARAALGVGWYQARYLAMLATAYARVGQAGPGLRTVAEAKDLIARTEEHLWEGELDRIEGELLQVDGAAAADVEAALARAAASARRQAAKSLELRAVTSLARLWAEQGRRAEAYDLLGPVYAWFTEGFETADLRQAKALLDRLT